MSKNNQTRRTKSLQRFSHRDLSVPRTGQSDYNYPAAYNSTINFYAEDEYLDLRIEFRFSLERGRR